MKTIKVYNNGNEGRDAKEGDFVGLQEILSGAGISSQGVGEVVEVCNTELGDKAYLVKAPNGKYRMLVHQDKWGYAYDYMQEYKLKS
jgi:hypothetical protein